MAYNVTVLPGGLRRDSFHQPDFYPYVSSQTGPDSLRDLCFGFSVPPGVRNYQDFHMICCVLDELELCHPLSGSQDIYHCKGMHNRAVGSGHKVC